MDRFPIFIPEAQYDVDVGPLTDNSCWHDSILRTNCQLFAHVILDELGLGLPKWLRSAELYRRSAGGRVWVEKITSVHQLKTGDICLFSDKPITQLQDPAIFLLHVGVCIEEKTKLITHISRYNEEGKMKREGGKIYVQPIHEILGQKKYNTLVGIRRPTQ